MSDKTWKQVERTLARRLGGQRVGCTGKAIADVISDWLSIEVKTRKTLPAWLLSAIEQARDDDRLSMVILHQVGQRHDDDLVVMRLTDFEEWFGGYNGTQDDQAG